MKVRCRSGLCCRHKAVQIARRGAQEQLVCLIRNSCSSNSSFPITRNFHEISPALRNSLHLAPRSPSRILQQMLEQPMVLHMDVDTVPCEEVWESHGYSAAQRPHVWGEAWPAQVMAEMVTDSRAWPLPLHFIATRRHTQMYIMQLKRMGQDQTLNPAAAVSCTSLKGKNYSTSRGGQKFTSHCGSCYSDTATSLLPTAWQQWILSLLERANTNPTPPR